MDTRTGVFDANGHFIIADVLTASLMDVSLVPNANGIVVAGGFIHTPVGSITSTIGAIARNPVDNQFYAVDNETDVLTSGVGIGSSSILVKIKDFTNPLNADVNFGTFLFDGTVSGRVFVSGSMDKFYAGWLITGDSSAGQDPSAFNLNFADNFHVNGDIHHVLSLASIGTDGTQVTARGLPNYFTSTQIVVGGKLGDVVTDDEMAAHVVVGDFNNIPNVADGNPIDPIPMTEDQEYRSRAAPAASRTTRPSEGAWKRRPARLEHVCRGPVQQQQFQQCPVPGFHLHLRRGGVGCDASPGRALGAAECDRGSGCCGLLRGLAAGGPDDYRDAELIWRGEPWHLRS